MKQQLKSLLFLGSFLSAFGFVSNAQDDQMLPEVTVYARNYKYLKATDTKQAAQPVNLLQRKAAAYDLKDSEYYEDDYDNYFITFYLPEGYILAVYDSTGKMIRTAEKFRNIALPKEVTQAVAKRYPNWKILKDTYRVKYDDDSGADMTYKLVLENGSKRLRTKVNSKGMFLD